jgi:uncharacterized hydrophobic protein (TIGR00271 family)
MLHLRIIAPENRTVDVLATLEKSVGTTHLVVHPGAARNPAGDVVLCDVAREACDDLLEDLRGLGLCEEGSVAVESIDLSLSDRAEQAKIDAPGEGMDAVLWDSLADNTSEESQLSYTYLAFLTVATMLAACGVMLDSAILIVGAMVVGPEFGPLAGVCTALVRRMPRLAWRSMTALLVGFPLAMVLTVGFSLLMHALGLFTADMVVRGDESVSAFVWHPDEFSFIVAVFAGVAGILSLTSSKSGALVGVAISVTTVPAAAYAAVAVSYSQYAEMWGAMIQLGLNLLGILLAGTLTLLAQKAFWARKRKERPATA